MVLGCQLIGWQPDAGINLSLKHEAAKIGLSLSTWRISVTLFKPTSQLFTSIAPEIAIVDPDVLLGAPVGGQQSVVQSVVQWLEKKLTELQRHSHRLMGLQAHDSFFLLQNCFSQTKLQYIQRCSPCFTSPSSCPGYVARAWLQIVHALTRSQPATWTHGDCMSPCPGPVTATVLDKATCNHAEQLKIGKYAILSKEFQFIQIAIETRVEEATCFLQEFGRRIEAVTRHSRSMSFLWQRLSVAVQKGNTACVLGTEHWETEDTSGCLWHFTFL